ncbi:MAG: prepilin peptidase [Actinobacteria bacterium]|nr:MAG: prepilin peptidase [Actinomycetota bacterium]
MTESAILCGLLGLIAGSFINVVAHRVPRGLSVVAPRSMCPRCGHEIRWHDNVPVLSWFLLRGRCRDCGERISARYPLVEAATGGLFAAMPYAVGVSWILPAYLWFVGVTMVLTLTDLDHKLIPNRVLYPGTLGAAVLLAAGSVIDGDAGSLPRAFGGAVVYFAALFAIALIARGGFGFGDVKLAFLLGMFAGYLGWGQVAVAGIGSFLVGGVLSVFLLLTRIRSRKDYIPFGPSMVLAAYLAVWFGDSIVDWWLG